MATVTEIKSMSNLKAIKLFLETPGTIDPNAGKLASKEIIAFKKSCTPEEIQAFGDQARALLTAAAA